MRHIVSLVGFIVAGMGVWYAAYETYWAGWAMTMTGCFMSYIAGNIAGRMDERAAANS